MEAKSMDAILGKDEPRAAEPAPTPETAETQKAETASIPVFDPESGDHPVPRKHFVEERKKRQEYERQIAEYQGRLSVYEQQLAQRAAQQQAETPSDDADYYSDPRAYTERLIAKATGQQRLELSQELMRTSKPDYDEMEAVFVEAARENPALVYELRQSSNPAKFAYDRAKNILRIKEFGSLDAYAEKVKAQAIAEYEAEMKAKESASMAAGASKSVAGARGSGASTEGASHTPTPMKAVVGGRRAAR